MSGQLNDRKPIFEQIKDWISDQIISETLKAHDRIPSTNEIVQFYKVNHLTVAKGVNQLVDQGIIYKKRGVGMFVAPDAKEKLMGERKQNFLIEYLKPMMEEAGKLGLSDEEIGRLIEEVKGSDGNE
ncbi:GntR family transcriptional regulator [Salinicoccus halodurans]|uniref:GntR family transcriptional regulator n=1 Tax=Salinicoccus halodurans TaxID=407035 RepID=A0A0F7HPF7_9STAP|nr:GntR family transcriptional regulator [Salinicoccus halodurans]AKG75061.1 GntR family transcriptional regulator [Salinicoccus halodurans]SFK65266.1 transcriptional regulator, GntR family [Salinicoccus halodurans]